MKISAARFLKDESGATAVEYALIAAGMAVAVIAMISTLSGGLSSWAASIASKLTIS